MTNSIPRKCATNIVCLPRLKTVIYTPLWNLQNLFHQFTTVRRCQKCHCQPTCSSLSYSRYAMSLLACGTLVPASLHKCDIGHLGYESLQSITFCTDITDNQTFASCSATVRHTPARFSLVTNRDTRYSTTEKQLSPNVKFPLSIALSCYYVGVA